MDVQLDTLLAYLAGTLPAGDRVAVDRALAGSADLRSQLERLRTATTAVRDDASWPVPAGAISAAKELGRRLDALRPPSLGERLAAAFASLADLTFDSRAHGALAGLRGETAFALAYRAGNVEIEFECDVGADDRFHLVGQITSDGPRFTTVHAFGGDGATPVANRAVDATGMFRFELPAGVYRLRFEGTDSDVTAVEVPEFTLP